MLTLQEYKNTKDAKGLAVKMMEARHVVHVMHLKSKSYSEHKALGKFYESLQEFLDDFVETHQGQYGLMGELPVSADSFGDSLSYLEDCVRLFKVGRDSLKDPHLQNIIDEVMALTYKTIYKLKFLK